jgi:hypothetical protein
MTATDVAAATTPEITAAPAPDVAAVAVASATPVALPSTDPPTSRRRRIIGMSIWSVCFMVGWVTIGIPTDPVEAFLWIWAATIAWHNDRPWRSHLRFVRDWAVVILLLVVYNISRGWASSVTPHVTEMINADTRMWGWLTGGVTPTIWLQDHLYTPGNVQWYEIVASFVYFSHFVMTLIVAAVLWMRNRERWLSYVRRWFTLTALILATYFIYPATPPWLASQDGVLPGHLQRGPDGMWWSVVRLSTRGWDALGLHHAGSLLNAAQVQEANQVAAMPSMHSAYALLVVAFFLPTVRKRWWPLLLAYPLAMTFALVYSGEHYVIDVLMGWSYVAFTLIVVRAAERLWAGYRARRVARAASVSAIPVSPAVETRSPAEPVEIAARR